MKNKRRFSFRKESEGWKGVSNPLLPTPLPFNGPVPAGRKYAGRPFERHEGSPFAVAISYLISFFSIPREKREEEEEGRRIRGSPIIIPLNAFLLAYPSQMGAAVNIRKTTVLGGVSFDVLRIAKESSRALVRPTVNSYDSYLNQKSIGRDRIMGDYKSLWIACESLVRNFEWRY